MNVSPQKRAGPGGICWRLDELEDRRPEAAEALAEAAGVADPAERQLDRVERRGRALEVGRDDHEVIDGDHAVRVVHAPRAVGQRLEQRHAVEGPRLDPVDPQRRTLGAQVQVQRAAERRTPSLK